VGIDVADNVIIPSVTQQTRVTNSITIDANRRMSSPVTLRRQYPVLKSKYLTNAEPLAVCATSIHRQMDSRWLLQRILSALIALKIISQDPLLRSIPPRGHNPTAPSLHRHLYPPDSAVIMPSRTFGGSADNAVPLTHRNGSSRRAIRLYPHACPTECAY